MTSSLTELRPPPTLPPIPSLQASKRPSTAGYWVAAVVAVLGLTAAFLWGTVGIGNTQDQVDGLARLAVPGATTVSASVEEIRACGRPTACSRSQATSIPTRRA
jgi:hypothetical protein